MKQKEQDLEQFELRKRTEIELQYKSKITELTRRVNELQNEVQSQNILQQRIKVSGCEIRFV